MTKLDANSSSLWAFPALRRVVQATVLMGAIVFVGVAGANAASASALHSQGESFRSSGPGDAGEGASFRSTGLGDAGEGTSFRSSGLGDAGEGAVRPA